MEAFNLSWLFSISSDACLFINMSNMLWLLYQVITIFNSIIMWWIGIFVNVIQKHSSPLFTFFQFLKPCSMNVFKPRRSKYGLPKRYHGKQYIASCSLEYSNQEGYSSNQNEWHQRCWFSQYKMNIMQVLVDLAQLWDKFD